MFTIGIRPRKSTRGRRGKVLIFVVAALPAILGIVGLVFDAGLMQSTKQNLQHASDAAATAAAMELALGKSASAAVAAADDYAAVRNAIAATEIDVAIPPQTGSYAGRDGFVEVRAKSSFAPRIMPAIGSASSVSISSRSVAGRTAATAGAAIVVLDRNPPPLQIASIPAILPLNFPALLGGLEILGLGAVRVDGAVLVNTGWGGVDENSAPAGNGSGPPYGISCTPLLSLTRLSARDVRVVGGVDRPNNFGSYPSGQSSPLKANRLAVPDPLRQLPTPSEMSASTLIDPTLRGSARIIQLPLIVAPTVLRPGVYDWIEIISGAVVFQPGVYIIRSTNPLTKSALTIAGGIVRADGVLFYITNSPTFDAQSGSPDNTDGESTVPFPGTLSATPSVVISAALPGSSFTPLSGTGTPFDGMLIYQRRQDYRPIVIVYQSLIGNPVFDGLIYAKWGHVTFVGDGTHDLRIVAGSVRLVPALGLTLAPSTLLPPAYDVFLVE